MFLLGSLREKKMAVGESRLNFSVMERGSSNSSLFDEHFPIDLAGDLDAQRHRITEEVRGRLRPGMVGMIDTSMYCAGYRMTPMGAKLDDQMFYLGAIVASGYVAVYLQTYSDAWLSHDLRGRKQDDIYALNHQRLTDVLNSVALEMGDETDPDGPTYYAIPTATGADVHLEADGTVSDMWQEGHFIEE